MSSPTTEVDGGTATSGPVATPDDRLPAFADAPVGLVLADHQGRIVAANDAWRRITGFSGVLPLDDHEAWALLHPEDRDEVRAAWAAACAGGDELEVRARMVTRDGDVRWTDTRATPVRDRSGLLLGFAGSVLDLTHVLDDHRNDGSVYLDGGHTNELGAHLVAEALWDAIAPTLATAPPPPREGAGGR